jgi:hypothetical protein
MVITDLSEQLIDEGARIVEKLDQSAVDVSTALWVLFPDHESWKLALSLGVVRTQGPKRGYELVQKALRDLRPELKQVSLGDIAVLRPDAPLLQLLRVALKTGPGVSRVWFKGNVINGELFPDALVYRVT